MILIIDNGSQYTHLIKRNCRDLGFETQIVDNKSPYLDVEKKLQKLQKIILSGGPSSVYKGNNGLSELIVKMIDLGKIDYPVLGVCFGHQLIAHILGGKVEKGKSAEYGLAKIVVDQEDILFKGIPKEFNAWVSHYDEVKEIPSDFVGLAYSSTCKFEAMRHKTRKIFGVQFHPEVWHTENGEKILENFLRL
ncbi:GMP synthase subunit A [Candidatus Micrarchaeota archaeon]|nr:GMP synthase subunit A [Candidatus Micrarchaeota archaeon]